MLNKRNLLFLFFFMVSFSAAGSETSWLLFPGMGRLEGVGFVYGAGGGATNLSGQSVDIFAGKTFGEIEAQGLYLGRIPLLSRLHLSYFYGDVSHAEFDTTYARGFQQRSLVRQKMQGKFHALNFKGHVVPHFFTVFTNVSFSNLRFKGYENAQGEAIPFSLGSLHDIETISLIFGFELASQNKYKAKLQVTQLAGRTGQSDLRLYGFSGFYRFSLSSQTDLILYTRGEHAEVIKEYPTGMSPISGQCGSITDPAKQSECLKLESDLNDYVRHSNNYGTVTPLGGSTGLRSYRELRFKAAHTHLTGIELDTQLSWFPQLHFAPFLELGHANDQLKNLFQHGRYSLGLATRYHLGKIPLRLEGATGNEGFSWFLSAGLPY